jgi:hypothetical protein
MQAIETTQSVKLLPDEAKDSRIVVRFTAKERYDYDIANCMFNKK